MKHAVRSLTLSLIALILISATVCSVSAAESDTLGQRLYQLSERYDAHLKNPSPEDVSVRYPGDVVFDYLQRFRAATTEEEKVLRYHQGISAGLLTYLYYMDSSVCDVEAVREVYLAQWAKIDPKRLDETQAEPALSFFEETNGAIPVEDCYTALLTAVYTAKLRALQASAEDVPDSAVDSLIASAIHQLNAMRFRTDFKAFHDTETVEYSGSDNYSALLDATAVAVADQRNREAAAEQLRLVYITLFDKSADFTLASVRESDTVVDTFLTNLSPLTAIKDMNTELKNAAVALLDALSEGKGSYETAYLSTLSASVQIEANKDATRASIAPLFTEYRDKLTRAQYKDRLVALEAGMSASADGAERNALVAEYTTDDPNTPNAFDAIFDTVPAERLADTFRCAEQRLLLYNAYVDTVYKIKEAVGNATLSSYNAADWSELKTAADRLWRQADTALTYDSPSPEQDRRDAEGSLVALASEAEARAFENTHEAVLNPTKTPTADQIKQAIADASALSENAIAVLQGRTEADGVTPAPALSVIGKRYRELIRSEIAGALAGEDSAPIRSESIATLQAAADRIPLVPGDTDLRDLTALPSAADALLSKAQAIDRVLDHYREQIDDSVKGDTMSAFCDTAAKGIISGAVTPEEATVQLNRMEAKALLERAAEGFTDIPGVQELLDGADAKLAEYSEAEEIEAYQAHAIKQLESYKTAKAQIDGLLSALDTLTHVSDATSDIQRAEVQTAYESYLSVMRADRTAIEVAEQTLAEELLRIATTAAKEEIEAAVSEIESVLTEKYAYISQAQREALLSQLDAERGSALTAIDRTDTPQQAFEEMTVRREALAQLAETADEAEREACFAATANALTQAYSPADFSTERQIELSGIVHAYGEQLDKENTVAENEALLAEALAAIDAVPNLLKESQSTSEARLNAAYGELMLGENRYSAENLAKLTEFYEHTLHEIKQFTAVADAPTVIALTDERIRLMREIRQDRLYTADGLLADSITAPPSGYDPTADGYSGRIEAANGLPSDVALTITPADSAGMEKKIEEAAKDQRILLSDGTKLSNELRKRLKSCHITAALRIMVDGDLLSATEQYTVSVLLPAGTELSRIIGVIYLNEDGSAEYMAIASEQSLIHFVTTHFSDFYLVSEDSVNLMPWIILLSVIIFCEALAIILVSLKKRSGEKTTATLNVLVFPALTVYRPVGGVWILAILIGVALALAAWLIWLLLLRRSASSVIEEVSEEESEDIFPQTETESEPSPESTSEPLTEEPSPEPIPDEADAEPSEPLSEKALCESSEPLSAVTAEEANSLMSDTEAKEELAEETAGYEDTERYTGAKKAEINVDTISEHFESGDIVTLNSLKQKKLIPSSAGTVKILARGYLDKPLTIVAQDFSTAALKMILLTGGTAVVTYASPERSGKKKVAK